MTDYTSSNALLALGMNQQDIQALSSSQKTGIVAMLDSINPGMHKSNNIPGAGASASANSGAATKENAWRPSAGSTLAQRFEGYNEQIMEMIDTFVLQDQNWLLSLATQVSADSGAVTWSFTEFSPKVPSQVPPRTRVRLLSIRKGSGRAKMTRKGIGAEFDMETLKAGVPRGVEDFIEQLNNINLSVAEGLKIDLMWQIMTAIKTAPVHINEQYVTTQRMRGLLDTFNQMTFSVVSSKQCVQMWMHHFQMRQRALGVAQPSEEHVWIMHYNTALRLHNDNALIAKYQLAGLMENPFKVDAAAAWAFIGGEPVYIARPFYNAESIYDPMRMLTTYNANYRWVDNSRMWPDKQWSPNINIGNVPNYELGMTTFALEYEHMLRHCGRFDLGTGKVRSMRDYREWGNILPEHFAAIEDKNDAFHPRGSDVAAFVAGSASGFSGKRACHMAGVFLESRNALDIQLRQLIRSVEEAASYMESAPLTDELIVAIAGLPKSATPTAVVGIRPQESTLQQADQDPSLKFVKNNNALNAEVQKTSYPPLFASGGGFSYLAQHGKPDVKEIFTKIVNDARNISTQLTAFDGTLAMDPRYSANGIFNSDGGVMLIDQIVGMRPNLFVGPAKPANGGPIKAAAEGYKAALAKYSGVSTFTVTDANAKNAFVVLAMVHDFQAQHMLSDKKSDDKPHLNQIGTDALKIITGAGTTQQAAAEATRVLLESHSTTNFAGSARSVLNELSNLSGEGGDKSITVSSYFRTPFRVSPSQVVQLANGEFAATVQRIGAFDQPAQLAELKTYAARIGDTTDPMNYYPHGMPIGRSTMIFEKGAVRIADAATRGLRPSPAGSALASSLSSALSSGGGTKTFASVWKSAAASASDSAHAMETTQTNTAAFALIGVADARAADIVTAEYIRNFNQIGKCASSDSQALLARMLLQLPLELSALISAYSGGIPPLLEFNNLTQFKCFTYPVIRMATGARSLIYATSHKNLSWGISATTDMLGVYLKYYTGTGSPVPQRIGGIEGVDPVEYTSGSAGRFESPKSFFDKNTGGLLPVAYFAPDSRDSEDHYFSLTGNVALANSTVSIDVLDLPNKISAFEMARLGIRPVGSYDAPRKITPPTVLGVVAQEDVTTPVYTQLCTRFGNNQYLESRGSITTELHNSNAKQNVFRIINEKTISKLAGNGK